MGAVEEAAPLVQWMFYFGVAYSTAHVVAADLAAVEDLVAADLAVLVAVEDLAPVVVGLAGVGKPNYLVTGLFTKAWLKSPIMSSTSSIPTARRTKPSSIPAF